MPEIEEIVDVFDGSSVNVGFTGEHSGGISNAQLAYILEYGSPARNLPARPAVGPAISEGRDKIAKVASEVSKTAVRAKKNKGAVFTAGLPLIGELCVNLVKQRILQNEFTPLAPATVKRKKSDQAWIDTGELFDSISYTIKKSHRGGKM